MKAFKERLCLTRSGRVTLGMDSGYKNSNIGFYPKSQLPLLRMLCAFGAFARDNTYSWFLALVLFLFTSKSSNNLLQLCVCRC